jgi:penicillin-binding protein 1C
MQGGGLSGAGARSVGARLRRVALTAGALALCARAALWLLAVTAEGALPPRLFDTPHATLLLARGGELLGARVAADEQWRFPPSASLPPPLLRALLTFEDKRFFEHGGVDWVAVARSAWLNLARGRVVSGASTISMQVVRLSLGARDRTLGAKLYEAWLALGLERRFSKSEILALYAAHAPFGGNVVGLDAAAWRYFGRRTQELTWAEAALLAALPNQPALMHLGRNVERLKAKRDALLRRLHAEGLLRDLDLSLSLDEPLPAAPTPMPQLAPHLLDAAVVAGRTGWVQTSIDAKRQRALAAVLERQGQRLISEGIQNAALVVINNRTLLPEVLLGNLPPHLNPQAPYLDLTQRQRSTGSTLKPVLFAGALDAGQLVPETLLPDVPMRLREFRPLNSDRAYRGAVRAQEALALSLNVPLVLMLERYGVGRLYDLLGRLGLGELRREAGEYGATLVIGGAEASLWEVTRMYALMARQLLGEGGGGGEAEGVQLTPLPPFTNTQDLLSRSPLSRGALWLTFEALTAVTRPVAEQRWRHFEGGQRVAWKTGTSQGFRDGWAVGVTPRYTVGVWAGNAHGEGRPTLTGAQAAAPLLFEALRLLDGGGWFIRPDDDLETARVCAASGYLAVPECPAVEVLKPRGAPFTRLDPFYELVHLDSSGTYRVTSACWPVHTMRHEPWFVLPLEQAALYSQHHLEYRPLPPLHPDCAAVEAPVGGVEVVYPEEGASLYLPVGLSGARSELVMRAASAQVGEELFWHLDGEPVGSTRGEHALAAPLSVGWHRLVVVSEGGEAVTRIFRVIGL